MKTKLYLSILPLSLLLTITTIIPQKAQSQDLSVSTDVTLTSRFIYRGLDLGASPQVQPSISFGYNGFNLTFWGSHPLSSTPDGTSYKEVKFWANYTFDAGSFTITPQIENHFDANSHLFDVDSETTTHVLQASLRLAGKGDVAPDFLAGYAFAGPEGLQPTIYLETGLNFSVAGLGMRTFISGQYSEPGGFVDLGYDGDFVITQIGLGAVRVLNITETFAVPLGYALVVNPYTEMAMTSFSISF